MSLKLCRLCLNNDRLIYMFDDRLSSQQQLRTCILLCTGVDIKPDDSVSRHVCHNCCIISVKLFKYRQNAIASDKALKEYVNQKSEEVVYNKEGISQLHETLVQSLSKTELNWIEDDCKDVSVTDSNVSNKNSVLKSKSTKGNAAVHASVRKLFKRFPKIIIPNDVLPFDIEPAVVFKNDRLAQIKTDKSTDAPVEANQEAIDRLKQVCPSLNIVRIKTSADSSEESQSSPSEISSVQKDLVTSQPLESSKRKRILNSNDSPDDDDEIEVKQKRICISSCTPPPATSEHDKEDHNYFSKTLIDLVNPDVNTITDETENDSLCSFCGRMYDSEVELKLHEDRMHPICSVCSVRQKSAATLSAHLNEVCYKNIEANPPKLELTRVNEIPELLQKYKDSFDYHLNASEDDDCVEIVSEFIPSNTNVAQLLEERIPEWEYLVSVFKKYEGDEYVPKKSKYTRMQVSDINIKYDAKNRIIVENMYSDLKIFKVPLNLKVSSKVTAHVSIAPKVKMDDSKDAWDMSKAIDIKPKFRSLYSYVTPNKLGISNFVVPKTSESMQNILLFHPSSVAQAPSVTCAPPRIAVTPSTSTNLSSHVIPNNTFCRTYNSTQKKVENSTISSVIKNIDLREFFLLKNSSTKAMTLTNTAPQGTSPMSLVKIIVSTSQQTQAPMPAKVTVANRPTPSKEGQSLLRVKAPWEINSQLLNN